MLVDKETGRPVPAGKDGFLESFVVGFDPTVDSSAVFDNSTQGSDTKSSGIADDPDFYRNQ
jgi:hypothetical protein